MTAFDKYISNIQEQVKLHDSQQFATQILPIVREVKKAVNDNSTTISKYKVIEREFEKYIDDNATSIENLSQVSHQIGFTVKKIVELQKQIGDHDTLLEMVNSETKFNFAEKYNSILNKVSETSLGSIQSTIDSLKCLSDDVSRYEDNLQLEIKKAKLQAEADAKAKKEREEKAEADKKQREKEERERIEREKQERTGNIIMWVLIIIGVGIGISLLIAFPWLILVIGIIAYFIFKNN
jgi:cation transport ATPase